MTPCQCCSIPVWVMYSPATCDDCEKSGCNPLGPGADFDVRESDFATITIVRKKAPCRKGATSVPPA